MIKFCRVFFGIPLSQIWLKLFFFGFSGAQDPDYVPENRLPPGPDQEKLHHVAMDFIRDRIPKLQELNGKTPYLINWECEYLRKSVEQFKPYQTESIKYGKHLFERLVYVILQKHFK